MLYRRRGVTAKVTLHNIGQERISLHSERSIVVFELWKSKGETSELLEVWPEDGQSIRQIKHLELSPGEESSVVSRFNPPIETDATIRAIIRDGDLELADLDLSFRYALPGPG